MNDKKNSNEEVYPGGVRGFLSSLVSGIAEAFVKYLVAFVIGTGAGAVVCWYYSLPLALSLVGGVLVLALALAFSTDSLFD